VVLTVIRREPGITQTMIGDRTSSDPNSITALLRLLEKKELIRREIPAHDGRARCVFLTAAGRRMQRRAEETLEPTLATLWQCFENEDRDRVHAFLERVQQAFAKPNNGANGQRRHRRSRGVS
jgi:DNA-binding MarR family transcriptional regulator